MEKLNEKIPGLPRWPGIYRLDDGRFVVQARHASYGRYWIMNKLVWAATLAYVYYCYRQAQGKPDIIVALWVFMKWFFPFFVARYVLPIPFVLTWFFNTRTSVYFGRDRIVVGGKPYTLHPGVPVEFRANRSALSDKRLRAIQGNTGVSINLIYERRFQMVEMIYGARIEKVATLSCAEYAWQFATALQAALQLAAASGAPFRPMRPREETGEDDLPE